jgi:NitT/TauT family transport system ATP-binding protein
MNTPNPQSAVVTPLYVVQTPEQAGESRPLAPVARGEIRLEGVTMQFSRDGVETTALEAVDLRVRPGEFVSLLGPSGCGKSTLLNLVAGILNPSAGTVTIDNTSVTDPNPTCNVVFQQHSLFPWMRVLENVAFGPRMLGHANPEGVARTFLSLVGLERFARSYPAALSGGMQQRVAIARALATYPPVLLMDEPFGALDAQTRSIMQEELLKIWAQFRTTVVFVTHDVDEAIFLSDRIVVMRTQPGAVKEEIIVDLPRPRTPAMMLTDRFTSLRGRVLNLIREETLKVFQHS